MMLGVPCLFKRHERTRKMTDDYNVELGTVHQWKAMEVLRGAPIRITVRSGEAVRIEAIARPNEHQKSAGISDPWFRDIVGGPEAWLRIAVESTDLSTVPDGEWQATAIGEKIMNNHLNIEGHKIVVDSLFPWDTGEYHAPPSLGRFPIEFEDLRFTLTTTPSAYSPAAPMEGVIWWLDSTPVAYVKTSEFPSTTRTPSDDVLIPLAEEETFVPQED